MKTINDPKSHSSRRGTCSASRMVCDRALLHHRSAARPRSTPDCFYLPAAQTAVQPILSKDQNSVAKSGEIPDCSTHGRARGDRAPLPGAGAGPSLCWGCPKDQDERILESPGNDRPKLPLPLAATLAANVRKPWNPGSCQRCIPCPALN